MVVVVVVVVVVVKRVVDIALLVVGVRRRERWKGRRGRRIKNRLRYRDIIYPMSSLNSLKTIHPITIYFIFSIFLNSPSASLLR